MDFYVKFQDANDNEIDPPLCACGQQSTTFIQGKEVFQWRCNDCMFGEQQESKSIYKTSLESEYGGTGFQCALSDKEKQKLKKNQEFPRINLAMEDFKAGLYRDAEGNEIDLETWSELSMDPNYKIVGQDQIGGLFISTVWLGLRHFGDTYFETMIFPEGDWGYDLFQRRYQTREVAKLMHDQIVEIVKKSHALFDGDEKKIMNAINEWEDQ